MLDSRRSLRPRTGYDSGILYRYRDGATLTIGAGIAAGMFASPLGPRAAVVGFLAGAIVTFVMVAAAYTVRDRG